MALDTYANLQQSVIDFSHRSDLDAKIPDFIRLAEDKVYALIESDRQDVKTTLSTVADQEYVTLPTDFIEFRSLSIANNGFTGTLDYLAPDQYQNQYTDSTSGFPRVYTIIGDALYARPIADAIYTLNAVYSARLATLSVSNTTNWLLTNYPMVYLYASLEQLAKYIKDEAAALANEAIWTNLVAGINRKDEKGSATMQVKTDVNLSRPVR
jgi:hypothetical protein